MLTAAAANHLGPFAFTMKLLPLMQETAKADPSFKPRIINMSSIGASRRLSCAHFAEKLAAHEGSRTSRPRFQSKDDINASYGPWKIGAWKRSVVRVQNVFRADAARADTPSASYAPCCFRRSSTNATPTLSRLRHTPAVGPASLL